MAFLAGAAIVKLASRVIRSIFSEEKDNNTAEYYKGSLANKIRLARAIIDELPARQAIKNWGMEKWRTDLIAAADEGDVALRSSAADSRALEKALRNLEALTKDAKAYIDYSFKSEVIEVINSAAAGGGGNPETPIFIISVPTDICRPNGSSEVCHPLENIPENQNPVSPVRTPSGKKFCPSNKISKTRTGKISKKRRGLGLKQNSHKHSIGDCTKTWGECPECELNEKGKCAEGELNEKGKCPEGELNEKGKYPEGELNEQTRYREATIATLSCSPSGSFKGAE